ncbi:hypothetical protein SAMN06265379_101149 [Saccharicrinis carchari]|uniref:Uncharacterized protein n=1 Tax=Saccharicrinis carchari TaxID=1168039 RepID=A0A521AHR8_SACCC|nr:hypothetical protein [Saccharicrinis carchari]SMO34337.1 hypothetical protein SAMN06265379_101149 [Saccharicrinis carchari]
MKKSVVIVCVTIAVLFTGCDFINKIKEFLGVTIPDATEQAIAVIDRGINQLGVASADWQDIMSTVIEDLPDEVQSTIKNEVSNLLQRGIAAVGAEFRCNVDFLRIRMRQGLQRIKSKLLGTELPAMEPHLCQVVPSAIDMSLEQNRRNKIEFFGYDFDATNVQVLLVNGSREVNVTRHLDRPTHYAMTLNLGASGVRLNAQSKRIILRWNGRNISSMAVIQAAPNICESKFKNILPSNVSGMPYHTAKPGKSKGDKEFDGHGPRMYCSVTLINEGNRVRAKVYATASETTSDWTYGKMQRFYTLYNVDPGYVIEDIVSPTFASYSYTDRNHAKDVHAGSGPVQKFILNGDGPGDDIGRNTKVEIQFNPIRLQLKETGDCVSTATIRKLQMEGVISTALQNKIIATPQLNFLAPSEIGEIETETILMVDTLGLSAN